MNTFIYKACRNSISTLELLPDSITNETRDGVVNSDFAKFRTNKAKVISIVNPETNEQLDSDCSGYSPSFVYKVGKEVSTIFDPNINKVCGGGIHYFKTYEGALSWYYQHHYKTNGKYIWYYENGQKEFEHNYKDGMENGQGTRWHPNGQKWWEFNYKEGLRDGKQEEWRENGQKLHKYHYKGGILDGKQEEWYENGQKDYECNYKDGLILGD